MGEFFSMSMEFENVSNLLRLNKYGDAAKACEKIELETVGEAGCQLEWVYSAQILCFLVADQINDARFCWKRVPRNLAGSEEIQGVRGLLEALWEKDYVRFHGLTQSRQWSDLLSSLVAALVEATRSRTIRVVSEAKGRPKYRRTASRR